MNNKVIAIILGVAVIGGGIFLLLQGNDDTNKMMSDSDTQSTESKSAMEDTDVPESFSGTMAQLLTLGKNFTCTFTQNNEEVRGTGTVYISGDIMRGDFIMELDPSTTINASVIQKDGVNYAWSDSPMGTFGTKITIEADDGKNQPVSFDEEIEYSCKKWSVDASKFDLPTGVNFTDLNATIKQINGSTGQMQNSQCGACEQIPDAAAKAQCLAALGC